MLVWLSMMRRPRDVARMVQILDLCHLVSFRQEQLVERKATMMADTSDEAGASHLGYPSCQI
jgi:hypothetical protein